MGLPLGWTEENEDPSQTTKGIPFKGRIALQYYLEQTKDVPNWKHELLYKNDAVGDLGWKRVQKFDNWDSIQAIITVIELFYIYIYIYILNI